jgi:hypothetical protein
MAEIDSRRWEQIRQIRERRQRLAAARAAQAAADWQQLQHLAQQQDAAVREQADARRRHGRARVVGASAADWRESYQWSGELQRRIDDGGRLALLSHAEAMQAQLSARAAQTGARRAAHERDRAQQAIERAEARAEAAAQQSEERLLEDLALQRWWRGDGR